MKTTQDCSRWREAIRLQIATTLEGEEATQVVCHLAGCADCRSYAKELRDAAAGLRWLGSRDVEPSPGFHSRWTQAVEDAARPSGLGETAAALVAGWRELLRRNLRPALGMASLWILTLLFRLSAPDAPPPAHLTAARSPVEIIRALGAGQSLVAWQHWKRDLLPVAPRQPHTPQPRSERFPAQPTGQLAPEPERPTTTTGIFATLLAQRDSAALSIL